MAEREAIFKLSIESQDAVKNVKKLDGDLTKLAETLEIEVSGSISAMEDTLYQLALAGQQNTKEFKDLQAQVAKYKQVVIETDRSIDALAEQGRGLSTALSLAEGTVAGFQAFTGVTALMGTENEELLETITKLQAAQGVLNSIEVIKQQLQQNSIKLTQAQGVVTQFFTKTNEEGIKSINKLKVALAATGIGVLVIGITLLIQNWDKLKVAISGTTKAQELANQTMSKAIESASDELNALDKLKKTINDENVSREEKSKAIQELQKEYPKLLSNVDAEKSSLEEVNRALELNAKLTLLKAQQDAIAELRVEEFKKQIQAQTDAQSGANESLAAWAVGLTNAEAGQKIHQGQQQEIVKGTYEQINALDDLNASIDEQIKNLRGLGASDEDINEKEKNLENNRKAWADAQKARQEDAKRLQEEATRILNEQFALEDELAKLRMSANELEIQNVNEKYDAMMERAHGNAELEKQIILAHEAEIKAIKDKRISDEEARIAAEIKQRTDANTMIQQAMIDNMVDSQEKENAQIALDYETKRQAILENEALTEGEKSLLLQELKVAENTALMTIQDAADEEALRKEQEKRAAQKALFDDYANSISSGLNSIASLSDSLTQIQLNNAEGNDKKQEAIQKKAFERNKKIQIAMATISMIQGIINALTAQSVIPEPFGTILKAVNAVAVGAAGIANIAKIKSQKYKGGGGSTSGSIPSSSGASAGASASSFNFNSSSAQTQLNPDGTPVQSGDKDNKLKVFVTETDISNTQDRAKAIDVRSTF